MSNIQHKGDVCNRPPGPIWSDEITGMAVHVNGGLVEVSLPDEWSGRLLPSEAATLATEFAAAIAEATAWAERWDIVTGSYRAAA